jgi:hypothetical protein
MPMRNVFDYIIEWLSTTIINHQAELDTLPSHGKLTQYERSANNYSCAYHSKSNRVFHLIVRIG